MMTICSGLMITICSGLMMTICIILPKSFSQGPIVFWQSGLPTREASLAAEHAQHLHKPTSPLTNTALQGQSHGDEAIDQQATAVEYSPLRHAPGSRSRWALRLVSIVQNVERSARLLPLATELFDSLAFLAVPPWSLWQSSKKWASGWDRQEQYRRSIERRATAARGAVSDGITERCGWAGSWDGLGQRAEPRRQPGCIIT